MKLNHCALGKKSTTSLQYDASLLFPITRKTKRQEIGILDTLPFTGHDLWNAYEISWLNTRGKPIVATGQFHVPCESDFIIESKSLKLYLNSFSQTPFASLQQVKETIQKDLTNACQQAVLVNLFPPDQHPTATRPQQWQCLDDLDVEIESYLPDANLLQCNEKITSAKIYSNLLKSNCLVTNQPDWGSLFIDYKGPKINNHSLLKYIISFRCHSEFHEQCVERIFMEILDHCRPHTLTVFAKYTRRGGIDINPFRTNDNNSLPAPHFRLTRQ